MSCAICRLPFIPDPKRSTNPLRAHFPPPDILTPSQTSYFQKAIGDGLNIPGGSMPFVYFSANMFGGNFPGLVMTVVWETDGSTVTVTHTVCAALMRRALNCESDSLKSVIAYAELEVVLGRGQGGAKAGWYKNVDYAGAGEKIDIEPFWKAGEGPGENVFLYKAFVSSGHGWMFSKPDIFPKFQSTVTAERLASVKISESVPTTDILTRQPIDVILSFLPFLCIKSYIALTSTCRLLRYHALTTLQTHARKLVLSLPWAFPNETDLPNVDAATRSTMANAVTSPSTADWFLYLSHIHRTKSMRARRWIWGSCEELKRAYLKAKPTSDIMDIAKGVKSPAMKNLENRMTEMFVMKQQMMIMVANFKPKMDS